MTIEQLITLIAAAVNARTLYPENHPRVVAAIEELIAALQQVVAARKSEGVTFLLVGEDLVAEQEVLRKVSLSNRQFVDILHRSGVERLTLAAGLDGAEAMALTAALATGKAPDASKHVVVGRVRITVDRMEQTEEKRELSVDQIDIVRDAFARFRTEQKLPVAIMEDMVWGFIDSLSRATRRILPLAKLKEHDEYTFVHSVNVSLLVLSLARSFGIEGTTLHAFGMAGLLHDIGKLMVPVPILNKPGKLEGEEWTVMQGHAEQGAWYLAEMEGAMPLTAIVAYEHHLRYDGKPAYPILRTPRLPNVASRMVSICDAYDAMSTVRPYQQPVMRASAVEILQKRAETFYDPLLVATFGRLVAGAP